jgi:SsrA-binding protein
MLPRDGRKIVATNRKARHRYHVVETWEAGLVLTGSEVKSLRAGKVSLAEGFARVEQGEVWLHNVHIAPYAPAHHTGHDPLRPRKCLLHKSEIRRITGLVERAGYTLVPLELYFRDGRAKVTLALARGKAVRDRREELKQREAEREVERAFKRR